jgi:hypothetical protein
MPDTVPPATSDQFSAQLLVVDFKGALRAVLLAVSKDDTRPHLCAVQVEVDSDEATLQMVGTDGHRLHAVTVGATIEPLGARKQSVLLDRASAEALYKALPRHPKEEALCYFVTTNKGVRLRLESPTGKAVVKLSPSPETFPPWRKVVPASDAVRSKELTAVDPRYLADAGLAGKYLDIGQLDIYMHGECSPVVLRGYQVYGSARIVAVLMPRRR